MKTLKFWNGRGHGKYDSKHVNVAAYTAKEAAELIMQACEFHSRNFANELRNFYSQVWGNDMIGIAPKYPCVYVTEKQGTLNPLLVLDLTPKEELQSSPVVALTASDEWKCHNAFARFEIRPDGAKVNIAEVYQESDAHIIAASKEMYEALKYARRFLNGNHVDVKFIDAAIAKAEGK